MLVSWTWLSRRWHSVMEQAHLMFGLVLGLSMAAFVLSPVSVPLDFVDLRVERMTAYFNGHSDLTNSKSELNCPDRHDSAEFLAQKVRLLICVMTSPKTVDSMAAAVKETWGQRVEMLLFLSSVQNRTFPTIGLNVSDGPDDATGKTNQGFRYIYDHHMDDADWFMMVDENTYVIVENLLYFLSDQNPHELVFFGHQLNLTGPPADPHSSYNCRAGGYVLSREALRKFGEKGQTYEACRQNKGQGEKEFANCMHSLGIGTSDTTDAFDRTRFHCFSPEDHLAGKYPEWYTRLDPQGARKGLASISDFAITFHNNRPDKMAWLQYYVYHLQPFGVHCPTEPPLNKHRQHH